MVNYFLNSVSAILSLEIAELVHRFEYRMIFTAMSTLWHEKIGTQKLKDNRLFQTNSRGPRVQGFS